MARLTVFINEKPGRIHRIDDKVCIGRDSANEVQILDQKVSRHHVTIVQHHGFFVIRDLGSRNGTFINEVKVDESELKTGDRIRIGNTQLVFTDEPALDMAEPFVEKYDGDDQTADDGSGELLLKYGSLKDQVNRFEQPTKRVELLTSMSKIISFASNSRPIESGHLLLQEIQDVIHDSIMIDRSYVLLRDTQNGNLRVETVKSIQETDSAPDFMLPVFDRVVSESVSLLTSSGFKNHPENSCPTGILDYSRIMCAPIRHGLKIVGMLYVDRSSINTRFNEMELAVLSAIGCVAGASISVWQSGRKMRSSSFSTMLALSKLAEKRFLPNVKGTTERITGRILYLCEKMGLPDDQIEMILEAAFLSSMVTSASFSSEVAETIPEGTTAGSNVGTNDLSDWMERLPGMNEISRLLVHRYENFDGTGLPDRLKGNSIPMGSRILRAVLILEELGEDYDLMTESLKILSGSVLDPMIVRLVKQFASDVPGIGVLSGSEYFEHQETDPMSAHKSQENQP